MRRLARLFAFLAVCATLVFPGVAAASAWSPRPTVEIVATAELVARVEQARLSARSGDTAVVARSPARTLPLAAPPPRDEHTRTPVAPTRHRVEPDRWLANCSLLR